MINFKKTAIASAIGLTVAVFGAGAAQASLVTIGSAISGTASNFSMLSGTDTGSSFPSAQGIGASSGDALGCTNCTIGGTNDVAYSWNGQAYNSSSDFNATGATTGAASTMTLSSSTTFFGHNWTAHDIQTFAPGTYSFAYGTAGATFTMTVGAGQLGGHMLFNWNGNNNIDVFELWGVNDGNGVFGSAPGSNNPSGSIMYHGANNPDGFTATQGWGLVSLDTMMPAGPFAGDKANFNMGTLVAAVPLPSAAWLFGSGLLGLAAIGRRKKKA